MIPTQILYDGHSAPPPAVVELRAGPLRMLFDNGDLRYVRLGEVEVVRRVYVAIRDRNWGTVAPVFSNLQINAGSQSFEIDFDVHNQQGEIDFAWHGRFTGSADGRLRLYMAGAALTSFWRNRIGFCVLLPAACPGQPCQVEHLDGSRAAGPLPEDIDASQPVLPFTAMRRLEYGLPGSAVRAEVLFQGDEFEMEDQRNWTDASFKIFSTPLALPFPVQVQAGERVIQALELGLLNLAVSNAANAASAASDQPASMPGESALPVSLANALTGAALPRIGLGVASHGAPLTDLEIARLKALRLAHLRVDLRLSDPAYPARLAQAAREAAALGANLELAVFVSEEIQLELEGLRDRLAAMSLPGVKPLARLLVYPAVEHYQGGSPTVEVVRAARAILGSVLAGVPLGCGTNSDFIFLKRTSQPLELVDCLTLAMNPQVHAFDNASLLETLEAQPVSLFSTRRVAGGKPVVASPITLKPRHNPYATGPAPSAAASGGQLPPQVDARQVSLFAAGWTLGSLRAMLVGGAASVTYYETSGWRGVLETASGSPLPALFPSLPGAVFPLYHVFAALADFAARAAVAVPDVMAQPLTCARPLQASALLLRAGGRTRLLLASHSPRPLPICLTDLPGPLDLRLLDETNAEAAMRQPELFWSAPAARLEVSAGRACLTLLPYALLIADL